MARKPAKPGKSAKGPGSAWTLLVYLADSNLTHEMTWNLQELKKTANRVNARKRSRINVVAHFDPRGSRGRRYDFVPPADPSRPVPAEEDGNLDRFEAMVYSDAVVEARTRKASRGLPVPADARPSPAHQLAAFLREQVKRLPPAEEFFLVLSGHGSGAVGDFLTDLDPETSLSIPELAQILADARKYYAEPRDWSVDDVKIGILGMDSCLMSNAEVCFEVRESARFLVGSEGFVSNTGWPYHRVLEAMTGPGSGDPRRVAEQVARNYSSFYRDYEIGGLSTDIAVCSLEAFGADGDASLVGRLRAFSREWIPRLEAVYAQDVLTRTNVRPDRARELLTRLAQGIADDLLPDDEPKRRRLLMKLGQGRAGALKELRALKEPRKVERRRWTVSQLQALRQLLDLVEGHYHVDPRTLRTRLRELAPGAVERELEGPSSYEAALAAARVFREFDPGVQAALELIEEREEQEEPEARAATQARARLQKLHQVRWLLDLYELTEVRGGAGAGPRPPSDDDRRLADALVAARFQAQSFKAGAYVDLFDLCRCLENRLPDDAGSAATIAATCGAVRAAIEGSEGRKDGAVVLSRYTGPAFQHAHGLSVYFPTEARVYAPEYENLQLPQQTGWGRLLRAYLHVTRRGRRDESEHWDKADDHVLRFGDTEIDPLEADRLEARIVGVARRPSAGERFGLGEFKGGSELKSKGGSELRAKGGSELRAKGGSELRAKGEGGTQAQWGNPPDGFFRQPADEGSE